MTVSRGALGVLRGLSVCYSGVGSFRTNRYDRDETACKDELAELMCLGYAQVRTVTYDVWYPKDVRGKPRQQRVGDRNRTRMVEARVTLWGLDALRRCDE